MATYKKKATLETKDAGIFESARYSPDGRVIAALHNAGRVRLYSAGSGSPAGSFAVTTEGDTGHHGITFSPDGKRLAVGGTKGARVYDFPSGKLRLTLPHEGWVTGVAFSHDGKRIATACHDKTARLWDAQTGKPKATFEGHPGIVNTIAFSRDGKTLATGAEAEARLWDVPQ
jgi:WD40 repeat protein